MSGGPVFPTNPTVGQLYTFGTTTWQWNGTQWVNATAGQNFLPLAGGTMTGAIVLAGNAASALQAVPLQQLQTYLPLAGGTLSGNLTVSGAGGLNVANGPLTCGATITGNNVSSTGQIFSSATGTAISAPNGALNIGGTSTFGQQITVGGAGIIYSLFGGSSAAISFSAPAVGSTSFNYTLGGGSAVPLVTSPAGGGLSTVNQIGLNGAGPSIVAYYNEASTTVSWAVTFSDRRLKTNIVPAAIDALAIVNGLTVYASDLTPPFPDAQAQHWDCSLIADEVEGVVPAAFVPAYNADSYQTLSPLPLICMLWRAVQQLSAEVAALKNPTGGTP